MQHKYTRREQLFVDLASLERLNYDKDINEIIKDLRERLERKPMYEKLENRLKRDIGLLYKMVNCN